MKTYIIGLLISVFFLIGCNDIALDEEATGSEVSTVSTTPTDTVDTAEPIIPVSTEDPTVSITPTDTVDTIDPIFVLEKQETIETIAKEWYVRLVVEDTTNNMKTTGAQLGQLDGIDVVTQHTLKALAPFSATYLDVVFVDPVGVDVGSYKSNFHMATTNTDTWEFTVKSHDSNATMILSWRGLYVLSPYSDEEGRVRYDEYRSLTNPLLPYMTLLDVSTNIEIDVLSNGAVNEYVFHMDGATERVFRWIVKDTSIPASAALPSIQQFSRVALPALTDADRLTQIEIAALRKDAKATPDLLEQKRLDSFDMLTPPKFEVLVK